MTMRHSKPRRPGRPSGTYTQLGRVLRLWEIVQAPGVHSVPTLATQLGISERGVYRDVAALRDVGKPVAIVGGYVSLCATPQPRCETCGGPVVQVHGHWQCAEGPCRGRVTTTCCEGVCHG